MEDKKPVEMERVEVEISGKLFGFKSKDESDADAHARLIFEAEQRINAKGDIRVHIK